MADIRIKDLATTATTTASDDFMAVDGATNGTRKMNAAAPAFLTSVTTPSLTSPTGNNLTLGLGIGGTALTLTSSTLAATFAGSVNVTGVLTSTGTLNTSAGSAIIAGSSAAPAPLAPSATRGIMHTAGSTDTIISWGTATVHNGYIYGSAAVTQLLSVPDSLQMVVGGSNRGTFSSTGLAVVGAVTVSSSTAGSASAGALVVTGGLSAGNNGNASYFGGAVTISSSFPELAIRSTTDAAAQRQYLTFGSPTYNRVQFQSVSAGTNDGSLELRTFNAGAQTLSQTWNKDGSSAFAGAVEITGPTTLNNDVYQTALKKFYVDSGSNTYFHENSADSFQIVTGGTVASTLTAASVLFNGIVIGPATTANYASIRLPHGTTAPTSPVNGDMWTTTAGLFIRINGATVGPLS
jgi:hypothetical protein